MVARAVAAGDAKHASKKDVELLKKLCVEFKDELAALGAKTDKLDKRVTKLEKGIGSWNISGRFKFDVAMTGGDNGKDSAWTKQRGKYDFTRDVARLFLRRQITEDTYFDSQFRIASDWGGGDTAGHGDSKGFSTRKFYVGTKLPFWGIEVKIGRSQFDWEELYDLYDYNSLFGAWRFDGFWFTKKWSKVQADFLVGRNQSGWKRNEVFYDSFTEAKLQSGEENFLYSLNLKWTPTDKLTLGAMGYWQQGDKGDEIPGTAATKAPGWNDKNLWEKDIEDVPATDPSYRGIGNIQTYGVVAGYKFTNDVALKGIYYWQKLSSDRNDILDEAGVLDKSQYAFKAILDVKQNLLKFTDLWVEYSQMKNGFGGNNGAGAADNNMYTLGGKSGEPSVFYVRPVNNETSKLWYIRAEQKWNKKWSTFLRYVNANWGTDGVDNAYDWGVGVKYKLNPAITFMLAYDEINYGDNIAPVTAGGSDLKGKDRVIFFQTDVKF